MNDKIYRVDLSPAGIADDVSTGLGAREIVVNRNPFSSSVVITAEGFNSNALLEIYSLDGHIIYSTDITDSFVWNGTDNNNSELPPGNYIIRVSDSLGESLPRKILKL